MEPLFEQLGERLSRHPPRAVSLPGLSLREAAVLVPLFFRGGRPFGLFTKRPTTLRQHAGQISFPGGTRDEDDLTPLHTALREAEEELGIPPHLVKVSGMLDELPTITQFRIIPFVGVIPDGLVLRPSPEEIEEVIEVPLPALLRPGVLRTERWGGEGPDREIHFYDYGAHTIWGATARILHNLLSHLVELPAFPKEP